MQTDLLNIFFEEAEEHLQSLNENVLNLEQNPADMGVVGKYSAQLIHLKVCLRVWNLRKWQI